MGKGRSRECEVVGRGNEEMEVDEVRQGRG